MSALFHAIVVARATGTAAADQLRRTLEAVGRQSRTPDGITVVACGRIPDVEDIVREAGASGLIRTTENQSFARAVALAQGKIAPDRAVWLLTQDTVPGDDALAALAGALERGPSVAIAAPKLVRAEDPTRLASLGISMTRLGRTVPLVGDEADQGQHDADDDVLGSDVRGILIRHDMREALEVDDALKGADEGLDLGVRARLAGGRVALAPAARVVVSSGGVGDLPRGRTRRAYVVRTAQLHRRLAYAPAVAVPLHWLLLLPLALWRTLVDLVAKRPRRVMVEWAAALTVLVRFGAIARSRSRIRKHRTGGWSQVDPLRVSSGLLRAREDDVDVDPVRARDLGFFSGGGAWAVLGALAVGLGAFFSLLAWPALGGGALLPLSDTIGELWRSAAFGLRPIGLDDIGAADPFSTLVAIIGSLWPVAPSRAIVVLWVLALPLAVLGAWFASTRVAERSGARVIIAIAYALSPSLLAALVEGRPAAVLAHLLLPWLFFTGAVAHRSWATAGAASVLMLGVLAAAPSLAPVLVLAWAVMVVLTIVARTRGGIARVIWLVVPSLIWFAPIVAAQLRRGTPFAAFADPGAVVAADSASGWMLAAGFPTSDPAGWQSLLSGMAFLPAGAIAWVVPLLAAPLALLALFAPMTARWRLGAGLLVLGAGGIALALLAPGVQVSFSGGDPVALWPGSGLSLAWLAVALAAGITLDAAPMPRGLRGLSGIVAVACIGVIAVPALTAVARDDAALTNGPTSTLPAYVGAEASGDAAVGTLILSPREDGSIATRVVWGESETLGGQSTLQSTSAAVSGSDQEIAELSTDLIAGSSAGVAEAVRELGLRFVMFSGSEDGLSDAARSVRLEAISAIDQRDGFARVGQTARGVLWRLDGDTGARTELTAGQHATALTVWLAQGAVLLVAILLSVPTSATRRAARGLPAVVGRRYEEKR